MSHDDCLQPRFGEPKESGSEYRLAPIPNSHGTISDSGSYVNFSAWSHLLGKLPNNLFDVGQAFRGHNTDFHDARLGGSLFGANADGTG